MKNFVLIFFLTSLVFVPLSAILAITAGQGPAEIQEDLGIASPIGEASDFLTIMIDIAKVVYYTFFVVAFIFIILAAFSYLTAGDDTEKIKTAHKQLTYAAIAIAIALIAVGASTIIYQFLES